MLSLIVITSRSWCNYSNAPSPCIKESTSMIKLLLLIFSPGLKSIGDREL